MLAKLFIITCSAGLIAASAAFADGAQTAPAAQPASTANRPDPVICHSYVHEGMLLHAGECHTQKVWDRMRHDTEQEIFELQMRGMTGRM
jgi:hypothetical protein